MSNILNHNRRIFRFNVSKSDYWDMFLYIRQSGDNLGDDFQDDCLAAYIDTAMDDCLNDNGLMSLETYKWDKAINNGVTLNNIGFTGVDNGLLTYDKDTITQEEFDDIFQNSTLETGVDDMKLYLNKVAGNNKLYSYGNEIVKDGNVNVSKLNGGFYQGFFQTDNGCEYRVLPSRLDDGWTMEFVFKPEFGGVPPSGTDEKLPTLNDIHPENKGIFFYIGTRAENKWWKYYNSDESGSSIFTTDLTTDSGLRLDSNDTVVDVNNKFVTYNRSKNGLLVNEEHTGDEYARILFDEKNFGENYYLYVNRSKDGYTVENIDELKTDKTKEYDIVKDLVRNALAFQVKEDGKIGYKYMVPSCETETGYAIAEEWSYPERIKNGEWNYVAVRVIPFLPDGRRTKPFNEKSDLMRLIFYVNGKIVLYSKPLPSLFLRMLNDVYEKQEGVPFNISVGGGTQGLCDVVYNLDSVPEDLLYLEKEFGGSLEGYFKVFRFHACNMNYEQIYQNYRLEKQLRWI